MLNVKVVETHKKKYPSTSAASYFKKSLAHKIRSISSPIELASTLGISYSRFMRCLSDSHPDWFSPKDALRIELLTKKTPSFISKCAIRPDVFAPTPKGHN